MLASASPARSGPAEPIGPEGTAPPSTGAAMGRWVLPLVLVGLVLFQALLRPERPGPHDPVRLLQPGRESVVTRLRGRVLDDPQPPSCRVLLEGAAWRTELAFATCPELRQGWRVAVEGRLSRPRPAPHPLLAGAADRLARRGAWTRLRVERLEVLAKPPTPIADLRRTLAARLVAVGGAERGGLLAALVLGSAVVPLPDGLREAFRASGLSHALAASGFHLTVLLGAVMAVGRGLGRAGRLTLGAAAIVLFLLLAGPQPSVVRAVLMGGVALVALESGRRGRPLGLLGVTVAVMLLLRPGWLHDVGFQLSVAATAGLVVTATPLEQWLLAWLPGGGDPGAPEERPGRVRRWLAPALAVPLAATLWTLPLQLLHFGALPLYAVPANLAATPLLTPLTLGAMGLALVALAAPPLLPLLAPPVLALAHPLLAIAHGFASLPMAQWQTGRPLPLLVLLLSLGLLGWVVPALAWRWRLRATCLLALVVATHLALLGGDRLLLVHQDGWGGAPGGGGGRDLLLARTRGRGALIASHGDGMSCAQARRLTAGLGLQRLDWLLLLDPVAPADPACWRALAGVVVAYGEDGVPLRAGESLASPGLAVEALTMDSHALSLDLAGRHWLLLPDRQALWAWQAQGDGQGGQRPAGVGLWLGFAPRPAEVRRLLAASPPQVWLSGTGPPGRPLPRGWRASGASGFLVAG